MLDAKDNSDDVQSQTSSVRPMISTINRLDQEPIPCSSFCNLTCHLNAIADHANLDNTNHTEDCFCNDSTDATPSDVESITKSLTEIDRQL